MEAEKAGRRRARGKEGKRKIDREGGDERGRLPTAEGENEDRGARNAACRPASGRRVDK